MALTLKACLPCLTRPLFWDPMVTNYENFVVKYEHLGFHVLFLFSICGYRRSVKIENTSALLYFVLLYETLSTDRFIIVI